ncbi:MAG TPA: hypothetical protein VFP63_06835 [Dehalococcoidia bacterium]|nr:hypothetical protein [Dehalococcoidia bacterium]
MKRYVAIAIATLGVMLPSGAAFAHNAAHINLPNGNCVSLGAGNTAALPDQAQAPTNSEGELDLYPPASGDETDGDQFGARFAATLEQTPLEARHCPQ